MLDMTVLAEEIASIVTDEVQRRLAPHAAETERLSKTVGELLARSPEPGEKGADGKDGANGRDGRDADPEAIKSAVAEAIAALPVPANGVDGRDGLDGKDGADGRDGADGKDGAGIADLLIDRTGNLVASFTDGRMKTLGVVVGRDGSDGADGKDGRDGMGPEDLAVELLDDRRTVRFAFCKGDTEYAFNVPFPVVIDRGVFSEASEYAEGDGVTWGGSFWIAQRSTTAKPDGPDSGWRLAVKRGRDGKDKV